MRSQIVAAAQAGEDDVGAALLTDQTAPRAVIGDTPDVARWMRCPDFVIGKPGPGSLSEAVHLGWPLIVTRNAWALPQERWNTEWVRSQGLGIVKRSFRDVGDVLDELLADLPACQARAPHLHNRAVFEVPAVLAQAPAEQADAAAEAAPAEVKRCRNGATSPARRGFVMPRSRPL